MDAVDVALCLAIDVSASVDFDEFGLMLGGYAAAFRDPSVAAACAAGPRGAIAAAVMFWSGTAEVAVPWRRVDAGSAAGLADALDAAPRLPFAGATALGDGMAAGLGLLARCPYPTARLVLDVSGDGAASAGRAPGPVRDLAVAAGVTINGLVVLDEEPDLLGYYRREVVGGPGSFVLDCASYADFAPAILRKLRRELSGGLLSARGVAHDAA